MVSSIVSSRSREGFRRPSDREDIDYRVRGQLGLSNAKLNHAELKGADLRRANLWKADLRGAVGITNAHLEQQASSLKGATMPDSHKYEDWLKDRSGRKEEGEKE